MSVGLQIKDKKESDKKIRNSGGISLGGRIILVCRL